MGAYGLISVVIYLVFVVALIAGVIYISTRPKLPYGFPLIIPASILLLFAGSICLVFLLRSFRYRGHLKDKAELPSVAEIVREQLSVLPDGAQDIYYSVKSYPEAGAAITFHLTEQEFKKWMEDRNPKAFDDLELRVRDYEYDPPRRKIVEQGYYWDGHVQKSLSYEPSYLEVSVIYDSQSGKVYYSHAEQRQRVREHQNGERSGPGHQGDRSAGDGNHL